MHSGSLIVQRIIYNSQIEARVCDDLGLLAVWLASIANLLVQHVIVASPRSDTFVEQVVARRTFVYTAVCQYIVIDWRTLVILSTRHRVARCCLLVWFCLSSSTTAHNTLYIYIYISLSLSVATSRSDVYTLLSPFVMQ